MSTYQVDDELLTEYLSLVELVRTSLSCEEEEFISCFPKRVNKDGRAPVCEECLKRKILEKRKLDNNRCSSCNTIIGVRAKTCKKHSEHNQPNKAKREDRYVFITVDGKNMAEHRHIMSEHLERPLLPHENVHHINGIRNDNRLENLELWSRSQPAGQRVKDKLAWAREIIALYGDSEC